jgi:histidinol-phosphate aminotransferase
MRGYVPGEQPAEGAGVVKLNTNENPYPPSPKVAAAVAEAAQRLALYPPPMADPLREAAARCYGLSPDQVLVGNGSDELLAICVRACACDGGTVAYPVPTYSLYSTIAAIEGAETIEAPMGPNEPLPEALLQRRPDVLFLCSPTSPYGRPIPVGEIARAAGTIDGLVIADEAYVDFGAETALPLIEKHANLLVLRTLSKSFSLAGLRVGLAFGRAELLAELAKVKDSYNVSRLAIAAGVAAVDDLEWMRRTVARIVHTRERVIAELRARGFEVYDSAANFFWLDCGRRGGREVYERLREKGVLVRHFDSAVLRGGVRVTVGTDQQMDRFLEALPA